MKTLKSGIIIKDNRSLGCGISIENENTKYMNLCYTGWGFFLNMKGFILTENKLTEFYIELERMKGALMEANKLITKDKND